MILWFVGLAVWFLLMGSMYGAEGIWFPALFMGYGIALQYFGGETVGAIGLIAFGVVMASYIGFNLTRVIWRKLHRS